MVILQTQFYTSESVKLCGRSVARKETVDVHQKNWVCHIYCQINAKKLNKIKHAYWVLIC